MRTVEQIVVDASVVVKWFVREHDSRLALILHDRYVRGEVMLHAPDLLVYEVMNALLHSRAFSLSDLVDVGMALLNYRIQLHRLDEQLMQATIMTAIQSETTVYDAAYIALAQKHRWKFITADERLADSVRTKTKDGDILLLSELKP